MGKTALFHACEANDDTKSLVLAKLLFEHGTGLSSERLGIDQARAHAISRECPDLAAFLSFVQPLPLVQLKTTDSRAVIVTLFDKGVRTAKDARDLTPALLREMGLVSVKECQVLLQTFAYPEQTTKVEALAAKVSFARTLRGKDKPVLHPMLHKVLAEQLSRKNPLAVLEDFAHKQAQACKFVQNFTELQKAVVSDAAIASKRDTARRNLVAYLRKTLSGNVQDQLKMLRERHEPEKVVDTCLKLWQDILRESSEASDSLGQTTLEMVATSQVPFAEVQQAAQAARKALEAWEARHDASAAHERTIAALDALEESTRRFGVQPSVFLSLRHPEKIQELTRELESVQQAFKAEFDTLLKADRLDDAPFKEIQRAFGFAVSFYTRTIANEVSRLETQDSRLRSFLAHLARGRHKLNTARVTKIVAEIRKISRKRERLEQDLKFAREDANDGDAQAQIAVPALEKELTQVESIYKLDSELRKERARVLQHAEAHYPELLQDQKWLKSIGMADQVPQELSKMGLWLTNAKRKDFKVLAELAFKPGKTVLRVRAPDGRDLVLKSFHVGNDEWNGRFYRQVAALVKIHSAYIVRIQGAFWEDGRHGCILMPYYPGGDLAAWIRDNPHADVATRRHIAIGLLSGLHDLHSRDLIHCDVKPENVFLAPGLSPVLGDFDGVQALDVTMTQPLQTTIKYLAPELRQGNISKVGSAVDMFSVGVVLAELFGGLAAPNGPLQSLITALCSANPDQRPSALQSMHHEAFQVQPVPVDSCTICLDIFPLTKGVSCADGHFTCKDCLSQSVRAATKPDAHVKVLRDGSMCCVSPDCELLIPGRTLATAVPDEDFAALLVIVREHFERDAAAEQDRQVQLRVDSLLREHGLDTTTQGHLRVIENEVLNLACPRCSTTFNDFEGCCALKCSKCPCRFCAWCLHDAGDNADGCHFHVANCPEKPDDEDADPYFSDIAIVRQAWARIRAQRLRQYMSGKIEDQETRSKVRNLLQPLLTPDIVGDNFHL
ncbi:Protein kinase, putative [Hondaea fermentalgiana]|uniref:Protein kinase, putative n=1 Tax=Hondaea fermentalgiana TaxID=2315210 RepID=A0A2R5H1U4_9STRA|nr:Protein kinase, putative [Hondaea fermentalgiana]|eukprot:GBG34334.1 Protein kinase, putative [Hondaea fermentalgiana]